MTAQQDDATAPDARLDTDDAAFDDTVLDDADLADHPDYERHPDDVPEVNAWLTMGLFAVFVVTTVACFFIFDW